MFPTVVVCYLDFFGAEAGLLVDIRAPRHARGGRSIHALPHGSLAERCLRCVCAAQRGVNREEGRNRVALWRANCLDENAGCSRGRPAAARSFISHTAPY